MSSQEQPMESTSVMEHEPIHTTDKPTVHNMALASILSTKNCTIVHVTDITGRDTFVKVSGGMFVKSKKDESSAYAAIQAAQEAARRALQCGVTACHIKIRGRGGIKRKSLGPGAQAAIRTFLSSGIKLGRIECTTPIPEGGCRKKGGHRGRRV